MQWNYNYFFVPYRGEYRLGSMVSLHVLHTNSSSTAPSLQYVTERNTSALKGSSKSLWCIVGEREKDLFYVALTTRKKLWY